MEVCQLLTISALLQRECQETTTRTETSEHLCVRTASPFTIYAGSVVVYTAAHRPKQRSIGLEYRKVCHAGSTPQSRLKHVHDNYLPEIVQQMNVHVYPASSQLGTANEIVLMRRMGYNGSARKDNTNITFFKVITRNRTHPCDKHLTLLRTA